MRIKKTSQMVTTDYQVNGIHTTSQSQAYSCDYINNIEDNEIIGTTAWTNSTPTQSFSEQSITLNGTYRKIEIIYNRSTTSDSQVIITVYNNSKNVLGIGIIDNKLLLRQCNLNGTSLTFYSSIIYNTYGSVTNDNSKMIPVEIIGYK